MKGIVNGTYAIRNHIGSGSFGDIYEGVDNSTQDKVAIKIEKSSCKTPQLLYEAGIYSRLQNGVNVPKLYWSGIEGNKNFMVIELLGKSLEALFQQCQRHFMLKTVLMLADQMISSIEYFHKHGYIHRDIKPDNFIMGVGENSNKLYSIDFGLSKRYIDSTTGKHIPYNDQKSMAGTARYASVNALKGIEQSRRDDMESIGYVLVYLASGRLPWMNLPATNKARKYQMILDLKQKTPFEVLCQGLPEQFVTYFYMVRRLKFTQEPEYAAYRALFRGLFMDRGYISDFRYDWRLAAQPKPFVPRIKTARPQTRVTKVQTSSRTARGQSRGPNEPARQRNAVTARGRAGGRADVVKPPRSLFASERLRLIAH